MTDGLSRFQLGNIYGLQTALTYLALRGLLDQQTELYLKQMMEEPDDREVVSND
jgi:hypothetical protein